MTFDHHTQLIRPARTSGRCVVRYQGLRNFHTCPAPGLECNSTETAATTTTATVCKQSPMESTSLHNQTWRGERGREERRATGSTMLGVPHLLHLKENKQKAGSGRGPKMPENPHILRCIEATLHAKCEQLLCKIYTLTPPLLAPPLPTSENEFVKIS